MLKVDTSPPPRTPWTKMQALTNFIQLKPLQSSTATPNHNATSSFSHTRNTAHHQQRSLHSQPKSDRLKIFIGTWNMKGRLIDLEPFLNTLQPAVATAATAGSGTTNNNNPTLQPDSSNKVLVEQDINNNNNKNGVGGVSPFLDSSSLHPYHLLAIGTQECERDISESLFYPSKEVWEKKLSDYLGDQYKLLRCETLAGVHLAVFVWKHVTTYVKNVHSADIKTGWANMVGNKGAVAVSLDFGSQSLLFINCHLRAHQTKLAERNANIHRILHELQIKGGKTMQTQPANTIFRISSLKNLARSSKSLKSAKSAKSVKFTKSAKLKEASEKVEVPDEQDNIASSSVKPSTKYQNQKTTSNTNLSKKTTNNRATSSKKGKATLKPKNPPTQSSPVNIINTNKTTSANMLEFSSKNKNNDNSEKPSSKTTRPSTAAKEDQQYSVMEQFNHVFIFGDTNYRLNLTSRQFVLDSIQKQDFKTLLKYDQLTLERQQCTTPLATFKEHPINFIPTYKFDTLETIPTTTESSSSSSLPVPSSSSSAAAAATTVNHNSKSGQVYYPPSSSSSSSAPSSSAPQTPVTASTTTSSSSSSFVITPTVSLYSNSNSNNGSISIRYDTSPKQRIPSWTDRILWHDREQNQSPSGDDNNNNGNTIPPTPPLTASAPTMTSIATANPPNVSKSKLNLKWISNTLTRKNKNNVLDRGIVEQRPVDKSTICYHYNTVMDPRLMGASDHLPVIGIFGVWFDDWDSNTSSIKRTKSIKSIKSIKKKVPRWKKWF